MDKPRISVGCSIPSLALLQSGVIYWLKVMRYKKEWKAARVLNKKKRKDVNRLIEEREWKKKYFIQTLNRYTYI